jgi:hypothetical protein
MMLGSTAAGEPTPPPEYEEMFRHAVLRVAKFMRCRERRSQ